MVTIWDPEYLATKRILQGKATLAPLFAELANWIAATWQVRVTNIVYDVIELPDRRPRLQVIVEHSHESQVFRTDVGNFDSAKQEAVAARFVELVHQHHAAYETDGLLVVFSAFAPLARVEADDRITESELIALIERLADPTLWVIHRCFGRVTFMFLTDEQVRVHESQGDRERYADQYFELLRKNDEFGYVTRSEFAIEFDSKENFDTKYRSNWFWYDR